MLACIYMSKHAQVCAYGRTEYERTDGCVYVSVCLRMCARVCATLCVCDRVCEYGWIDARSDGYTDRQMD